LDLRSRLPIQTKMNYFKKLTCHMIMKKRYLWPQSPFFRLAALGLVIALAFGCSALKTEEAKHIKETREWQTLKNGYEAFEQKDYEKAAHIFNALYQRGKAGRMGRRALYGLACSRLIMAADAQQYNDALALWDQWAGPMAKNLDVEDPRMLTPLLVRLKASFRKKAHIEKKDDKIQALNEKMEAMREKIDRLTHQLKELEAIDQKIEQKKKAISSPQ